MKALGTTKTRAEETLRQVRDGVNSGMEGPRDKAADALERAGIAVKRGSRHAARVTERGGTRVGETMERTARGLRPARSRGVLSYLGRHPMQAFLLLGLMTGIVAIAFIPRLTRRTESEYSGYDELGPMA